MEGIGNDQIQMKKRNAGFSEESLSKAKYPEGKNYCLLIAINEYANIGPLANPILDIEKFQEVIMKKFDECRAGDGQSDWIFEILKEQDCTRQNIKDKLEEYIEKITCEDNLVLYFAGHGLKPKDEKRRTSEHQTYFAPYDAELEDDSKWLRWTTLIEDYFSYFESTCFHFLLIVDVCFGGSLLYLLAKISGAENNGRVPARQRRDHLCYDLPSRYVITSGRTEEVSDGQRGEHSPFARMLINKLEKITDFEVPLPWLFEEAKKDFTKEYPDAPPPQITRFGKNNQGGQFVFRRPGAGMINDIEIKLRDAFFDIDFKYQKDDFMHGIKISEEKIGMVVLNGEEKDGVEILSKALIASQIKKLGFQYRVVIDELKRESESKDEIREILNDKVFIKIDEKTRNKAKRSLIKDLEQLDKPVLLFLNVPKKTEHISGVPLKLAMQSINKFWTSLHQELKDDGRLAGIKNFLLIFILNRWSEFPKDLLTEKEGGTSMDGAPFKQIILDPPRKLAARDLRIWWERIEWEEELVKKKYPGFVIEIPFDHFSEEEYHVGKAAERICQEITLKDFFIKLTDLKTIIV